MQSTVSCDRPVRSLAHMILSRCARAEPAAPTPTTTRRPASRHPLGRPTAGTGRGPRGDLRLGVICAHRSGFAYLIKGQTEPLACSATPPSQGLRPGLRPGYAAELGDTAEHLVAVPADDDPMSRRCAGLAKDGCRLPAVASTCPHPSRTTNRWIAQP